MVTRSKGTDMGCVTRLREGGRLGERGGVWARAVRRPGQLGDLVPNYRDL